jgi:hypothetical protein
VVAQRDYVNPTKFITADDTKLKSKLMKITGRVKTSTKSMLSQMLYEFALYRPTTEDNAPQKRRHWPPKPTGIITGLSILNLVQGFLSS